MAIQKGTGFTNLNRIMQANRGNKLGQTVAGGIQGQVEGVQSKVKSAQEQFDEEAQKNRLDTPEAAQKRSGILNRFAPEASQVDMSKFQTSSGLQQGFDQNKAKIQQDRTVQEDKMQQQSSQLKERQDQFNDLSSQYKEAQRLEDNRLAGGNKFQTKRLGSQYKKSLNDLNAYKSQYSANTAGATDYNQAQKQLEDSYQKQVESEQAAFQKAEKDRLIQANLPTDQEITDFTKYRTGTYTGPKELQDSAALYGQAQQAEELGGLARSAGGKQELLRRFVGGNNYTSGQKQLDTSILGQEPGQLGAATRQTRGLSDDISRANQQASGLAQEYTGRAKLFGDETGRMIGETKNPLSAEVDTRVAAAQKAETDRQANLKSIQEVLSGTSDNYKGLDQWTRSALALQDAADKGYLAQPDIEKLMGKSGKTGLLQRGANLGLDMSKLLGERFTDTSAQNLGRTGVANENDVARLNALDRLSGKQGTDLEFLDSRNKFQAGKTGFNTGSLEDYISKTEAEKAKQDSDYAAKLAGMQPNYLQNTLANAAGAAGNMIGTDSGQAGLATGAAANYLANQAAQQAAQQAALASAGDVAAQQAISSSLSPGLGYSAEYGSMLVPNAGKASIDIAGRNAATGSLTGGAEGAAATEGGFSAGLGPGAAGTPAAVSAIAAMLALDTLQQKDTTAQTANMAGNAAISGAQAIDPVNVYKKMMELNLGGKSIADTEAGKQIMNIMNAYSKQQDAAAKGGSNVLGDFTGGVGGLTKDGLSDISKGNLANLAKNAYAATGFKSGERLLGNAGRALGIKGVSTKKIGKKIKKMFSDEDLKEDIEYNPKELQGFMDRIKPAAYDYKKEVQDDPRASKNRELGVMAQDLEKSKLGKEAVKDGDVGKVVDYDNLQPKMLASIAALNQRLKELENKKN